MGCVASSSLGIGNVVISLTPTDNLDVGSFDLIYTLGLNEKMFTKDKTNPNAAIYLSFPTLSGPIKKMLVDFQISKEISVENGTVDMVLTRNGEVIYAKPLFNRNPLSLSSVTYGCTIGNPVVNLSQAGDVYAIRIVFNTEDSTAQ